MTKNSYVMLPLASALSTILLTIIYCLFTYIPRDYIYAALTLFLGIAFLIIGIYLAVAGRDLIGFTLTGIGIGITASVCAQIIMALVTGY
jgi:uncharacterized protein (DUF697 family)